MKNLILFLSLAFAFNLNSFAQVKQPTKSAPDALTTKEPSKEDEAKATAEAFILFTQIQTMRLEQASCGYDSKAEGCATVGDRIADAYAKAVKNPKAMGNLIAEATGKYDQMREQTKSAAQVSQVADEQNALLMRLIVVQNQRIIELLEQLVKKR